MKDRSDDPSHCERTLLPRSYISPTPVDPLNYITVVRKLKWHTTSHKQLAFEMVRDGNVLFNDALNTFLFTVIWRRELVREDMLSVISKDY